MKECFDDATKFLWCRPFFRKCILKMLNGEELGEKALTKRALKKLWGDELVGDSYISLVFGVPVERVQILRDLYGLTHKRCIEYYTALSGDVLGKVGREIMMA